MPATNAGERALQPVMDRNGRRQRDGVRAALLLVGALGLLAAPASAFIRIDDFRDPQTLVLPDGEQAASGSAIGPGIFVVERDLALQRLDDTPGALTVTVDAGSSERLVLDDPAGVPAALTLVYDGPDGSEAIDFTGLDLDLINEPGDPDRFALRLQAGLGAILRVQVFDRTDPSGDTWSAGMLEVTPAQSLGWVELPFLALDEMGPNGPADLRETGAILFELSGPEGLALEIDEIRAPEPGSGAAGLAALLVLGALRRGLRPPRTPCGEFAPVR